MARSTEELTPGTRASARYIWITPSKVRQVADLITGKPVDEARRILAFTPKAAARHLSKVLESAISNAEHNYQIPQEELFVRSAWADEGPTHKRFQARARRAAFVIRKRTSHINVAVARLPEELREQAARPERRPRRPAAGRTTGQDQSQPEETAADQAPPKRKLKRESTAKQKGRAKAKPEGGSGGIAARSSTDDPAPEAAIPPKKKGGSGGIAARSSTDEPAPEGAIPPKKKGDI